MNRQNFIYSLITVPALAILSRIQGLANNSKSSSSSNNNQTHNQMKKIIHTSESRGLANHGWLQSRHTFSFASYYNPDRVHFGALRVLNDDIIEGGTGFGTHPHDNMEIISIPITGGLKHRDSMNNETIIPAGDIQIMSAGTGVKHSEHNSSSTENANFLQIWVLPKQKNIAPNYGQKTLNTKELHNQFQTVVAPDDTNALWINQDAYFSLGNFEAGQKAVYLLKKAGNGIYVFVIEGGLETAGETLKKRDAVGVWETNELEIVANSNSQILIIEVPMTV